MRFSDYLGLYSLLLPSHSLSCNCSVIDSSVHGNNPKMTVHIRFILGTVDIGYVVYVHVFQCPRERIAFADYPKQARGVSLKPVSDYRLRRPTRLPTATADSHLANHSETPTDWVGRLAFRLQSIF